MNLRSRKIQNWGKIQSKRQRLSSARSDEIRDGGEDIISRLPAVLLIHILSLLTEADANRTRILSNSWKNLWMFLPKLRFVMPFCWSIEDIQKFHDAVDQALAFRGGMDIERFSLYCSKNCDYNRVYDWVCTVAKCKVRELELRFPADRFRVSFCWDLFRSCNTLVGLTLRGEFVLDVPKDELVFPCLKKMNLVSIVYASEQSFMNLISGCPVLEELFVERQLICQSDNLQTFKVSNPSLKRLRLSFALSVLGDFKVVIDAPNLEYIYILDVMSTEYSLTEPLSLVEAYMKTSLVTNTRAIAHMVSCLSSVKILTLTETTLTALNRVHDINIPTFPNLVKLMLGIDYSRGWNSLTVLLNNMPNLEHMTFLDGLVSFPRAQYRFYMNWNPPVEVPACLRYKLKEITILNREVASQEEFIIIRYLFRNSEKLKTFKLNGHKIDPRSRKQLLNFDRGSKMCRVEFI